jgi:hypothetical protein
VTLTISKGSFAMKNLNLSQLFTIGFTMKNCCKCKIAKLIFGTFVAFSFLHTHLEASEGSGGCASGNIWEDPDVIEVMQTNDGTVYAITTQGNVEEIDLNKTGRYQGDRTRIDGITNTLQIAPYAQAFHSRAIISRSANQWQYFGENGQLQNLNFMANILTFVVNKSNLFAVSNTGTLWHYDLKDDSPKAIVTIPVLSDTKSIISVGNQLLALTGRGELFKIVFNDATNFSFKKLLSRWNNAQILPHDNQSFIVYLNGDIWQKKPDFPNIKLGPFRQGFPVGHQRIFKTAANRIFAYNPNLYQLPKPRNFSKSKKVVSIGDRCNIRYNIENTYYQASGPTNLFDWVYSDTLDTVTTLIGKDQEEITSYFNRNNLIIPGSEEIFDRAPNFNGRYLVVLRNLPTFRAPLDVDIDAFRSNRQTSEDEFIAKYLRRHSRMRAEISNNQQMFFIRAEWDETRHLQEEEIVRFFEVLERLRPGNRHVLVYLEKSTPDIDYRALEARYRFKYFNWQGIGFKALAPSSFWRLDHYAWEHVFEWIDKQ